MKVQQNSTGSLSACHRFDNPIVYAELMSNQTFFLWWLQALQYKC